MSSNRGFTLIELVAIIVLLGVLSISVVSRYSTTGSFAERTVRDRIVAIARYAQQRAMYDQNLNACYRFHIDAVPLPPAVQSYGAQRSTDSANNFPDASFAYFGPVNTDSEHPNNIANGSIAMANGVTINNQPINNIPIDIFFDGLGNPINGCRGAIITPASPTITIGGEFPQTVTVSGAGYVQ